MERMMDLESPSIAENLGNFWRNLSFKEVSSFSQLYSCGICLELRAWKRQEMCDTNIGKMRKFLRQRVRKKSSLEYACYGCERAGGCAIDKSMCRDASQVPQPTCYWHSGQLGNLTSNYRDGSSVEKKREWKLQLLAGLGLSGPRKFENLFREICRQPLFVQPLHSTSQPDLAEKDFPPFLCYIQGVF